MVVGGLLGTTCLARPAHAEGRCDERDVRAVLLTGGVAAGGGIGAAVLSAGILDALDDRRDFRFPVGAAAGGGVTLGLAALYAVIDWGTGCPMARESAGLAWSVPISLLVVGAALPMAIWGASAETEPATATSAASLSFALGGW
jgi:hypothetical protein